MHVLDNDIRQIEDFILSSFEKFKLENGLPSSVGIYCCPWAGWLTVNFNINQSTGNSEWNCPDFEFVEFEVLNLGKWQEEYESEEPTFKVQDAITYHNHDSGDEKLNEFFSGLLQPIARVVKDKTQVNVLLQFLDSNCVKMF